ncbi:hypothetical protein OHB26_00280 [Nocardia sp. NBC_01503]|uniref:hypothetical protein n=1 Tax=Nocardia sp. NBC_01503 TaxID=2975997 RepID=UPI002E7BC84C|nr:hypothetical protein [Nocardia sp. NBC_01503]WTL32752.1 hypothetical protein OHB26_00280 [Nocardia sp. NBC_01503]
MPWNDYTPAAATITAGIIGALAVRYSAHFARNRHGKWDALKTDLEIANLLDDADPMKEWLRDYVDVRLRLFAQKETQAHRNIGLSVSGGLLAFVSLLACVSLGWGAVLDERKGYVSGLISLGFYCIVLGVIAFLASIYSYLQAKKSYYELPGVSGVSQYGLGYEIDGLNLQLKHRNHPHAKIVQRHAADIRNRRTSIRK